MNKKNDWKRAIVVLCSYSMLFTTFVFGKSPRPVPGKVLQANYGRMDPIDGNGGTGGITGAMGVSFWMDGTFGIGTDLGTALANQPCHITDACVGNHRFSWSIPGQYRDGNPHVFYAYGTYGSPFLLDLSPQSFNISPTNPFPTPAVQSVLWEPIDSVLDVNPNAGAGERMYPDKVLGDTPTQAANRRKVRANATVSPAVAGVTVYFKSFDVDDPSSNVGPIDPNGIAGDDNKGMPPLAGTLNATAATTNSMGVASVELSLTMQPGDNFVIAASTKLDYLNGIQINGSGLNDSTNNPLPTTNAQRTSLLTVWRKLYVETDSMGKVKGNTVDGRATRFGGSNRPQSVIQINQTVEVDRFQNGKIDLLGIGSFTIASNTATTVTIFGATVLIPALGTDFAMVDDDNFDLGAGPLTGDEQEDVPQPNTTRIQDSDNPSDNVFAPAYVRPTYVISDNNSSVQFVLNTLNNSDPDIRATFDFDNLVYEADDFWVVYLLNSYQCDPLGDADPYSESTNLIGALAVVDNIGNGQGAAIFVEEFKEFDSLLSPVEKVNYAVAHEVGHLFGGLHADLGLMANPSHPSRTGSFSDITIDKIRRKNHP